MLQKRLNIVGNEGNFLTRPIYFTFSASNHHIYRTVNDQVLNCERVQKLLVSPSFPSPSPPTSESSRTSKFSNNTDSPSTPTPITSNATPLVASPMATPSQTLSAFSLSEARAILNGMAASTSRLLLRFAGWFLHIALSRMFHKGVHVGTQNLERIQELSGKGSVIFLPTHKSYLDFILVTFVCYANHIKAPYIAAGDNFRIPFIGWLARKHGAFFIKRRLEGASQLYRVLMSEYVCHLLEDGANLEFFIEAARSRSGRIVFPKFGLLSKVVEAVLDNRVKDLYIVPVGISFDHILDTGFPRELLGIPKVNESLWGVISGFFLSLHRKSGSAFIDFGEPISLLDFIENFSKINQDFEPQFDRQNLIKDLGVIALKQAQKNSVISDTFILSFLLLTVHRKGTTKEKLTDDFIWLKQEIFNKGYSISNEQINPEQLIDECLILLNQCLFQQEQKASNTKLIKPNSTLESMLGLLFYSNQLIHIFWGPSITLTAIAALHSLNPKKTSFTENEIYGQFDELLDHLNHENVILGGFDKKEEFFLQSINELMNYSLLTENQGNYSIDFEKLRNSTIGKALILMLQPIIESYLNVYNTFRILRNAPLEEKTFLCHVQQNAMMQWKHGLLKYGESCSFDLLKRGLDAFVRKDVVSCVQLPQRVSSYDQLIVLDSKSSTKLSRQPSFLRLSSANLLQENEEKGDGNLDFNISRFQINLF